MIAKASTACTYSLDPIALRAPDRRAQGRAKRYAASLSPLGTDVENLVDAITIDMRSSRTSIDFYGLLKNSRSPQKSESPAATNVATCEAHLSRTRRREVGGGERDRTDDPLLAKQVLSQLSYTPGCPVVGLAGFEPATPALSRRCSNQLSYRPSQLSPRCCL